MRIYQNLTGRNNIGTCFLIYSHFGYGKTYSLGTLPAPIAIINSEPKDPRLVLSWTKKPITFYEPESYDEEMELYYQMEKKAMSGELPFKSVAKDSLSFVQGQFKLKLEDDRYLARLDKEKARVGLIDRFRLDEADWGAVASMMKRITESLNRLSRYGIVVVATATVIENPRWNRSLVAAPSFQGKEFPSQVNGYFDFIGHVIKPYQILDDGTVKPPIVSFVSDDESYVAVCRNKELAKRKHGPLDFEKILKIIQMESDETP